MVFFTIGEIIMSEYTKGKHWFQEFLEFLVLTIFVGIVIKTFYGLKVLLEKNTEDKPLQGIGYILVVIFVILATYIKYTKY